MIAHDLIKYFTRLPEDKRVPPGHKLYLREYISPEISADGELLRVSFYPRRRNETENDRLRLTARMPPDIGRGNSIVAYAPADTAANTLALSLEETPSNKKGVTLLAKGKKKCVDYIPRLQDMPEVCAPLLKFFERGQDKILAALLWGIAPSKQGPTTRRDDLIQKYISGEPPKIDLTTRLAFVVEGNPGFLHEHPEVIEYWEEAGAKKRSSGLFGYSSRLGGTERIVELAGLHPGGLSLGFSDPVPFASANQDAFETFGMPKSTSTGLTAAESYKYAQSLLYLAWDKRHHYNVAQEHTMVFWASEDADVDCIWGGCLKPDADYVADLLGSAIDGHETPQEVQGTFHLLTLRNNNRRASIDDYYAGDLVEVRTNLAAWCRDLQVPLLWGESRVPSLDELCTAHMTYVGDRDVMTNRIVSDITRLMSAALRNQPVPLFFAERVLRTVRRQIANDGKGCGGAYITPAQAALLQLVYNRNPHRKYEMLTMRNPDEIKDPAFQYGRMVYRMLNAQYPVMKHTNDKYRLLKMLLSGGFAAGMKRIDKHYRNWAAHLNKVGNRYPIVAVDEIALLASLSEDGWVRPPERLTTDQENAFLNGWRCQEIIDRLAATKAKEAREAAKAEAA